MKIPSKRKLLVLGLFAVCVALSSLLISGCSGGKAAAIDGLAVKDSVNDYTWDELSQLSAAMENTGSEKGAQALAKTYNLVKQNGKLDGTQTKDITLADGTVAQVQVAGFYHDDKNRRRQGRHHVCV